MGTALAVAGIGATVVAGGTAVADGTATPTTVTVTANHDMLATGKGVSFNAVVSPAKVGTEKITGAVTFTITGADGSVVPCTSVSALTGGGKSRCKVDKGVLLAGSAPYTVVASYGGSTSGTFAAGSGTTTLDMVPTSTRVKLALDVVPTSGAATNVTATVVDGPATTLLTGQVVFTVASAYHAAGIKVACTGSNTQDLTGQTATCALPAGWMTVPRPTVFNPKPQDAWSVSAVYVGNTSFTLSSATKKGIAKS